MNHKYQHTAYFCLTLLFAIFVTQGAVAQVMRNMYNDKLPQKLSGISIINASGASGERVAANAIDGNTEIY